MAEDIKKIIEETAKATAKEVRHEFDLVIEDLEKGTLKAINEQLGTHTKQLERLQTLPEDVEHLRDDVEAIKVNLGLIKNDLKQKVDREELAALEERVVRLEARAR